MKNANRKPLSALALCAALLALAGALFQSGAQAQGAENELSIRLFTPGPGETYYAGPESLLYSIPIKGQVGEAADSPVAEAVDRGLLTVTVEIWHGTELLGTQRADLDSQGRFVVEAMVNPSASLGDFISPAELNACGTRCHHVSTLQLTPGQLRVVARVTSPAGQAAQVERTFYVDHSAYVEIPVHMVFEDGSPAAWASVSTATHLYLWRARYFTAAAGADGLANLRVEALGQVPTHYRISVKPGVVGGVLYEGVDPVEITLTPGEALPQRVTLEVRTRMGSLNGQVQPDSEGILPASVSLIHANSGRAMTASLQEGGFTFASLPIDRYILAFDAWEMGSAGYAPQSAEVDLRDTVDAQLDLSLPSPASLVLRGQILDENGQPLPFGWITVGDRSAGARSACAQALPAPLGQFACLLGAEDSRTLVARAPGYYNQAAPAVDESGAMVFRLVRRPETATLPWDSQSGAGRVTLPADTHARLTPDGLRVENGWVWGDSRGAAAAFRLSAGAAVIEVASGSFALEYRPGEGGDLAWLYLFSGEAAVTIGDQARVQVLGGQMAALGNPSGVQPVSLQAGTVHALHAPLAPAPVADSWQPALTAVLRDRLAFWGISLAKLVTSITYGLVMGAVVFAPLGLLVWAVRRGKRRGAA